MLDVTWSVFLTLRLPHLSPLLSLPVCLPLSICGVVDCEVLVLSLVFHALMFLIYQTFTIECIELSCFSLNLGIVIFLSNCRGH